MRVSAQKSTFFKKSVSFLGFVVTNNGAATDPEKAGQAKAIREFPEPTNVFEVRSFLGLSSYNRCFIKDFASIARPISNILKGENGCVSRHRSRNIQVHFSEAQQRAFEKLRNILASEDVILRYPNYKKAFDLTTDVSAYGIGAVLSQEGRPITMISRTLSLAKKTSLQMPFQGNNLTLWKRKKLFRAQPQFIVSCRLPTQFKLRTSL